jgi:hypothetical protein
MMTLDPFDCWLPISTLVEREPAFSEAALRFHIYSSQERRSTLGPVPGNGLAPAIRRVGRKVLIHHGRFRQWIETGRAG